MTAEDLFAEALHTRWCALVAAAFAADAADEEHQELADTVLLATWGDYDAIGRSAVEYESGRLLAEALEGEGS